jgi:hypothetical protein
MKIKSIAFAVAAGLGVASLPAAHAQFGIDFDPDGAGGPQNSQFNSFWQWENVLFWGDDVVTGDLGSYTLNEAVAGTSTPLARVVANLSQTNAGTTVPASILQKIVIEISMPSIVNLTTDAPIRNNANDARMDFLQSDLEDYGADNYFRISYNPDFDVPGSYTTGTDWHEAGLPANGMVILEGKLGWGVANDFAEISRTPAGEFPLVDIGANSVALSAWMTGALSFNATVCTAARVTADQADGVNGDMCDGGLSRIDTDFFGMTDFDVVGPFGFNFDFFQTLQAPLSQGAFNVPVPNQIAGLTPDFGLPAAGLNNFGINDFTADAQSGQKDILLASRSADTQWIAAVVDEPTTLAAFGMSLAVLGGLAGLRRRKVT